MTTKTLQIYKNHRVVSTLFAALIIMGIFYVYAVRQAVFNTVNKQKLELQIGELKSQIAKLESQSIVIKSGITMDLAKSLGFREVFDPKYVPEATLGKITLDSNEI